MAWRCRIGPAGARRRTPPVHLSTAPAPATNGNGQQLPQQPSTYQVAGVEVGAVPSDGAAAAGAAAVYAGARSSDANQAMVHSLQRRGIIGADRVMQAMLTVDRGNYVPAGTWEPLIYFDRPLPIGYDQTISAPHMHAYALRALADHLQPGSKALDVGSGSGYLAACMAQMVGPTGKVVGIEYVSPLVQMSLRNIGRADAHLLESGRLVVEHGDGWRGCPREAPFDCIHVGAAAEVVPDALIAQLKPGGRMFIPVGTDRQQVLLIDKGLDGAIMRIPCMDVRYVPLVRPR